MLGSWVDWRQPERTPLRLGSPGPLASPALRQPPPPAPGFCEAVRVPWRSVLRGPGRGAAVPRGRTWPRSWSRVGWGWDRVFPSPGLYAGIKFFLIDFIFKRCPRLRAKYDTPYIIWRSLPTDPQLKERSNAAVSRRVGRARAAAPRPPRSPLPVHGEASVCPVGQWGCGDFPAARHRSFGRPTSPGVGGPHPPQGPSGPLPQT